MFDTSWIASLDANAAADELARSRDRVVAAEAEQFCLAAHWADLHAPEFVADCAAELPGMARPVAAGADGCPQIDEFAGAELAALLGRSTMAGEQLVADAVNVRHRHPLLWKELNQGRARVWMAVKVARRCVTAGLSQEQAVWVDAQTTAYLATLPFKRFFDLVEARIIAADPAAAEARAEAAALHRFVRAGLSDEHGMRLLVARASAGDVTYLVAVLDRIAALLGQQGDVTPMEARRATALRILANPARALALLTGATLAERQPREPSAPGPVGGRPAEPAASDQAWWMLDSQGRPMPGSVTVRGDLLEADAELELGLSEGGVTVGGAPPADQASASVAGGEEGADPVLLERLVASLETFDSTRLDPVTVFYVHLSEAALRSGAGVARIEGLGPAVLGEVRRWLGDCLTPHRITLRPVLDAAAAVVPVDRYEHPAVMSELATLRSPFEVFPYGTLPSRSADDDHVEPYEHDRGPHPQRPPGQTRLGNNAKLGRFHHRLKTHGGWLLRHPAPGVYWWRTPHGHWFRVDPSGTHHHGRDPALE